MNKIIKDVKKIVNLMREKEEKSQLTEKDADELLEALRFSLKLNRAMINSIIGGKDK